MLPRDTMVMNLDLQHANPGPPNVESTSFESHWSEEDCGEHLFWKNNK